MSCDATKAGPFKPTRTSMMQMSGSSPLPSTGILETLSTQSMIPSVMCGITARRRPETGVGSVSEPEEATQAGLWAHACCPDLGQSFPGSRRGAAEHHQHGTHAARVSCATHPARPVLRNSPCATRPAQPVLRDPLCATRPARPALRHPPCATRPVQPVLRDPPRATRPARPVLHNPPTFFAPRSHGREKRTSAVMTLL